MNAISAIFLIIGLAIASISKELNPGAGFVNGLWPVLVGTCVSSFLWIFFQAEKHVELSKKEGVNHYKWTAIRLGAGLIWCSTVHAYSFHWIKVINLLIFGAFWFGLIFNLSYNHFGDHAFDYLAKEKYKNRPLLDALFVKLGNNGGKILMLLELLGMAVSGYVYCIR